MDQQLAALLEQYGIKKEDFDALVQRVGQSAGAAGGGVVEQAPARDPNAPAIGQAPQTVRRGGIPMGSDQAAQDEAMAVEDRRMGMRDGERRSADEAFSRGFRRIRGRGLGF